ncbi:PAS domain-containing hybrid sensor histidine kinase/response regulator [Rhodalgimonas zhirmunskyi]|uniref:Sensory/regulatory protein RpfC n=1 Tax=Rhodalgimonas zhirmunskyi TaxID=2964767 RepID=A0AAJ1X5V6_9RHOB|nr:ATP-binding protein [Rhodoalgimonas zhirmunskyi]MDQ2095633.1 ATP-binding protein [Rhodoalgimonas zhirmunskyi]
MPSETAILEERLAHFDWRNTPEGLVQRYALGRVRYFGARQVLALVGTVVLFVLDSPISGLFVLAAVLIGESIDLGYLRRVPRRLRAGAQVRNVLLVSALTGLIQSATIAGSIISAWVVVPDESGSAFALIYLTGAAMNAGLVLPYHRLGGSLRLGVFALTAIGLLVAGILRQDGFNQRVFYDFAAFSLMVYMVYSYLGHVITTHVKQTGNNRNLLLHSLKLARINQELEEQQREARNLALVARRANDSVLMLDPQGRATWVNNAFQETSGFTLEEIRGKRPGELLTGPESSVRAMREIDLAMREGRQIRIKLQQYRKDGSSYWVDTNIVPLLDKLDGRLEGIVAIERDITESIKHEEELARAKRAAEKGERAKAQFLATMSHEIRTPMNGIIGMTDLLSESGLDRESRHYIDTIRTSAEALLTIINDILDFSRLSAGKPSTHPVEFDLDEVIEGVIDLLTPQARKKRLRLQIDRMSDLPRRVVGDDGRLRQILLNIIGNAIKFTALGSVSLTVSARKEQGAWRLFFEVCDTGIGISETRLDRIFDEFAQADAETTRKFGGTGLGLSISRLLAREMGGDISVRSNPGEGSVFTVSVLFGTPATASQPATLPAEPVPDTLAGKVVLVAEDNRTNRLLVRKYLKDEPITLLFAANGRQAVDMTCAHKPDIVLMDMAMPEMDGIAATLAIRETAPVQPHIVALTANTFASDRAACMAAGMDGFLPKPLRKRDLMIALSRAAGAPPPRENGPPKPPATTAGAA